MKSKVWQWVVGLALLILALSLVGWGIGTLLLSPAVGEETAVFPTPQTASPTATNTTLATLPAAEIDTAAIASPTPTLVSPTATPSATSLPSATPTVTPTPLPWLAEQVIGYSVQGRPIESVRLGHGERWFVLLGALHGGHECNTIGVVEGILDYFIAEPERLPDDITLYAIPLINRDGCAANSRGNANGVDLNRNWDTPDWQADAEAAAGVIIGSGGSHPFSEPETRYLRDWLLSLQENAPGHSPVVISYHSAVPQTGLVQPGYLQAGATGFVSSQMARYYSEATGYLYSESWVGNYTITGELIYWANLQGIVAMDVELPDRGPANTIPAGWSETHIETNLQGVLAIMTMAIDKPDP